MVSKKYQYVVLSVLLGIGLWYGYTHRELFINLKRISVFSLIVLVLLVFASQVLNCCKFRYLMKVFETNLGFREWFGLSVCNTMFNYYLPAGGGIAIRAYYLKNRHDFSYSHYTSLIAGSYVITFTLSAGMGLLVLLLYKCVYGLLYGRLVIMFSGLLLVTMLGTFLLVLLLRIGKGFKNRRINNILKAVREGLLLFRKSKGFAAGFCVLNVAGIVVVGTRLLVCFSAISVDIDPLQMLIIPSLATFSTVLSLTPGNLGIREGIISYSAHLFGVPADKAMLAALIDRAAAVILTFSLGLIFSRILLTDIKSSETDEEPEPAGGMEN